MFSVLYTLTLSYYHFFLIKKKSNMSFKLNEYDFDSLANKSSIPNS